MHKQIIPDLVLSQKTLITDQCHFVALDRKTSVMKFNGKGHTIITIINKKYD